MLSRAGQYHAVVCETSTASLFDVLHSCPGWHRSCPGNPTRQSCSVGSQWWSLLENNSRTHIHMLHQISAQSAHQGCFRAICCTTTTNRQTTGCTFFSLYLRDGSTSSGLWHMWTLDTRQLNLVHVFIFYLVLQCNSIVLLSL